MNVLALIGVLLVMAIPKFNPRQCEKVGKKVAKAIYRSTCKESNSDRHAPAAARNGSAGGGARER